MCETVSTIPVSFECEQKNPVIPAEKSDTPVVGDVKRFINTEYRRWFRKLRIPLTRHQHNNIYKFVKNIKSNLAPIIEEEYVVVLHDDAANVTTRLQKLSV